MDHRKHATPVWPFLLVMAFLFAMSITSPRHWERFAQRTALEPPGRMLAHSAPRAPAAPQTVEGAAIIEVSKPVPAASRQAGPLPRVTSRYAPEPSSGNPSPTFAQPNLNPSLEIAGATIPGLPRLSGGPASDLILPKQPEPAAQPPRIEPIAPPRVNPAVNPAIVPNSAATAPRIESPSAVLAMAPAAAPLLEYRPSPSGFLLHGGHKAPSSTAAPAPVAPAPVAPAPTVVASLPSAAALTQSSVSVVPQSVNPQPAAPNLMAPNLAAPNLAAQAPAPQAAQPIAQPNPATSPTPPLVARRTGDSLFKDPTRTLPKAQELTAPIATAKPQATPSWWPQPVDLLARLDHLQLQPATRRWAERTEELVQQLTQVADPASDQPAEILKQLRGALADTRLLDESRLDPKTALEVRLTRHALQRRLDVWESLGGILKKTGATQTAARSTDELGVCLVELERETSAAGETGRQWRDYLMLDSLDQIARGNGDTSQRRDLARTILERMHRAADAGEQNEFLHQGAFAHLDSQLRNLAEVPLDGRTLLESIERFEGGGLPSDAHALAEQCRLLDYSTDAERRQLAVWLTSHYRNANLRVTLSADLLNRMLPEPLRKSAPVNETVLGMPTQGWSTTRTGIGIHFLPSTDSLAIRMQADGVVHAQTQTFSGPVRLFSHSDSNFKAYKDFSLTSRGVQVSPAVASTLSRSRLQSIKTNFDHIPLLGSIVESIALDEHAQKRTAAQREASAKISAQVQRGLNSELDKHLKQVDAALEDRVVAPLAKLSLSPEVIELQSNEARAIMRLRIAGGDQLASHTPRPRAYSDNVASVQLHQSAANNILERFGFQGRTFTAPELYRFAVEQLYLPDHVDPAVLPDDIEITFAKKDPITIRCEDGRVELRLAVEELKRGSKTWRDFVVRTEFKTAVVDGSTCFVRDGLVHLHGARLGTTAQIALRTVFAKVFADDLCVPLWPDKLRADPRFADLDVQQVDIRDGWLGMAIGPRRVQTTMGLLRPRR